MIGVLADDFSGASEIAGIAVGAGLSAHVWTTYGNDGSIAEFLAAAHGTSRPDLLVIDTDTRSQSPAAAVICVAQQTARLQAAGVRRFYKKIDSVLRGNVAAEIRAMVDAGGFSRTILLPANPSRGRVIQGGHYYVDGVPLDKTVFQDDPEHPTKTASLAERLAEAVDRLTLAADPTADLPDDRIIVAEAATSSTVAAWAGRVDDTTLAVGAAEFFSAWLTLHRESSPHSQPLDAHTASHSTSTIMRDLFVCGSAAAWSRGRAADCEAQQIPVVTLQPPRAASIPETSVATSASESVALRHQFERHGRAMLAIGDAPSGHPGLSPRAWVELLAERVAELLAGSDSTHPLVERIFVEGGMTAAALARRLGWNRFVALPPLAPGITPMTRYGHDAPQLIPKPGSYAWPVSVLAQRAT